MGIYLKPIPPHSGLTALQGGDITTGEFYHFTGEEHDYLVALFSGITTLSGTTIFSGNQDIGLLFSKLPSGSTNDFLYHNGTDWTAKDFQLRAEGVDSEFSFDGYVTLNSIAPDVNITNPFATGNGIIGGESHVISVGDFNNSWIIGGYASQLYGDAYNNIIIGSHGATIDNSPRSVFINSDSVGITGGMLNAGIIAGGDIIDSQRSAMITAYGSKLSYTRNVLFGSSVYSNVFSAVNSSVFAAYRSSISGTTVEIDSGDPNNRPISDAMHSVIMGGQYNTIKSTFGGIIGGSGNTLVSGADGSVIAAGQGIVGDEQYTFYTNNVKATSVHGIGLSGNTIYSGGTDLNYLFGSINGTPSTFVQQGNNIVTGGTPNAPTVNVISSPVFSAVTALSVSASTFWSGSTDLNHILAQTAQRTYVQPGLNITTGGTSSNPTINLNDVINLSEIIVDDLTVNNFTTFQSSVLLQNNTYVSAGAIIFSALSELFMQTVDKNEILYAEENVGFPYQRIVGNPSFTFNPNTELFTVANISAQTIGFDVKLTDNNPNNSESYFYYKSGAEVVTSPNLYYDGVTNSIVVAGANFSASSVIYSGGQDLGALLTPPTYVQGGLNTFTGGTITRPTVNLAGSISLTSVTTSTLSATTLSAGTMNSGATPMNTVLAGIQTFIQPGSNITTGGTPYRPTVAVDDAPTFQTVSVNSTFFSAGTDLTHIIERQRDLLLYKEINLDYEISPSEDFVLGVDTRTTKLFITLPDSVTTPKWWYIIKDIQASASANPIEVLVSGADTIIDTGTGAGNVVIDNDAGGATFYNSGVGIWICLRAA